MGVPSPGAGCYTLVEVPVEGLLPHIDVGSGSPVVLLHGFGLDARMWCEQVPVLGRHHRVLAPDLPGFGPLGVKASVARPAHDVLRLLRAKALGPVHLVGLSYGGAVAVDLTLAHPEAVRTLVLVDALLLGEGSDIDAWPTCVARAKAGDVLGTRAAWPEGVLFERVRARAKLGLHAKEMVDAYRRGHWRGAVETSWERPEPRPLLKDVRCPALVLVGEVDSPNFKAMGNRYAQDIPHARLAELGGLGHLGPVEGPELFNRTLLDFLEENEPGRRPLPSSARLVFGRWEAENIPLGKHLWGDPRVTSFITQSPFTPLQVEERVRQEMAGLAMFGVQYGPMFLRSTGELVGCCGFRPRPAPPGVLELGFLLRPEFWGQGLATEAARAAVAHAFEVLGASAIFAGHHPENGGSRRVLQKLGFRKTHLEHYPPTGLEHPSYLLQREDFRTPARPAS
jgi:[ribosomal protein S5]-alanine N-acetyltransferase